MNAQKESLDDFLAKQNLEENKPFWIINEKKISYVLRKTKKFINNIKACCDIGIGNGFTLRFFHKKAVDTTGVDISPYLVNYHKSKFSNEKIEIDIIEADITQSEIGKNKYDLVTCFDVLEHLPEEGLTQAIKNIAKSLKPNGFLIATLPYRENLELAQVICPECRTKFHPIGHHQSFNSIDDIENMLGPHFKLLKFGHVPVVFTRLLLFYSLGNFVFKLARRLILNQTMSTLYFVGQLK